MNSIVSNRGKCTGCLSCNAVCPFDAISVKESDDGFYIPEIDQQKCKECGLCLNRCPVTHPRKEKNEPKESCAAYHKDPFVRNESSSGGIYTAIAEYVIESGGCAVGAVWNEDFNVEHAIAFSKDELIKQRGSKYVQSNISKDIYKKIKDLLEKDTLVLFSGTGCQVAGLLEYLGNDYPNLITVDVLCHGVSSNRAWRKYLSYIMEKKDCGKIKKINMRDKRISWDLFSYSFTGEKGSYIEVARNDLYGTVHSSGLMLRTSCDECKFKRDTGYVYSDISIGDYWGGGKKGVDSVKEGISLMIINTEKGRQLFQNITDRITVFPVDLREAAIINRVIFRPDPRYLFRKKALKDLQKGDFQDVVNKHMKICLWQQKYEIFVFRVKRKLLKIINGDKKI